jgi:hypothetical protein
VEQRIDGHRPKCRAPTMANAASARNEWLSEKQTATRSLATSVYSRCAATSPDAASGRISMKKRFSSVVRAAAPGRRQIAWLLIVGLAVLSPLIVKLALFPSYPGSDDAFIHLRVASLFASGKAWGINPGQWVNMSSSPILTLVVSAVVWLGGPAIGVTQLITSLAASAGLLFTFLTARKLGLSHRISAGILVLAAVDSQLWRWSGTVMESAVAFMSVAGLLYVDIAWPADQRNARRWAILGVLTGLAALVRFEIALLAVAFVVEGILSRRRRIAVVALVSGAAAAVAPWLIFARVQLGTLLPTTLAAKAGGWHLVNATMARQIVSTMISAQPGTLIVAVVGLVVCVRRRSPRLTRLLPALWLLLAWPGFYYLRAAGLQSPGRYLLPVVPAAAVIVAVALPELSRAADTLRATVGSRYALVGAIVALQVLTMAVLMVHNVDPVLRRFNTNYRATMSATAAFLGSRCTAQDRVLLDKDVGVVSYTPHGACVLVDGGGLANPELAKLSLAQQIARVRPALLVESLGASPNDLSTSVRGLTLIFTRQFHSHSVESPNAVYTTNVYRVALPDG